MLSQLAQEKELGNSLLERLFKHYKSSRQNSVIQTHTASLLTNYRCHPSILTFTSSLFYEHTLLSRSESQTHPLAPYPLVFTCSSIDKTLTGLPAEDQREAEVLVEKMHSFVSNWPRNTNKPTVGLLASTRKQVIRRYKSIFGMPITFTSKVNILKHELNKRGIKCCRLPCNVVVKPTYLIQGISGIIYL